MAPKKPKCRKCGRPRGVNRFHCPTCAKKIDERYGGGLRVISYESVMSRIGGESKAIGVS